MFDGFDRSGSNASPAHAWSTAPASTQNFALSVHDPVAADGSGRWHSVMLVIPANVPLRPAAAKPRAAPVGSMLEAHPIQPAGQLHRVLRPQIATPGAAPNALAVHGAGGGHWLALPGPALPIAERR